MFDMVDTVFSYWRKLIVYYFFQESFKVKESSLHEIWNADTAFLLSRAALFSLAVNEPLIIRIMPRE